MNDVLHPQCDVVVLGDHVVDLAQGELFAGDGHRVRLRRQSLSVLLELARHPGRVLPRERLAAAIWKNVVVGNDSLVQCIVEIRRALGPVGGAMIKTVPRRGYVLESRAALPTPAIAPPEETSLARRSASAAWPRECPGELPFIGRGAELALLSSRTFRSGGLGQVAVISGEPGIGKSRLAEEAAEAAISGGASVLVLKCHEIESGILYGAMSQLVERLIETADAAALRTLDATSRAELAALTPWCVDRLEPLAPIDACEAPLRQARLRASLVRLCGACASARPVVICIDDAHWLDEASAAALFGLALTTDRQPCSIWATVRNDEVARRPKMAHFLQELLRLPHVLKIALQRLGHTDIETIVRRVHGPGSVSAAALAELVNQSAGNPFYLRELLHAPASTTPRSPGEASQAASWPVLPPGIMESVLLRAQRLPKAAARLLESAAVLEQAASFDALCSVARVDHATALDALALLCRTSWLVEDRDRARYTFAHDKLREAIYVSLISAQRRELHGRAARSLMERPARRGTAPEHAVIATHALRAGIEPLAMQQFALAADAARQVFELRRAEALYTAALDVADGVLDDSTVAEHITLLERRGAVRSMLGSADGAEADLRSAIRLVTQLEAGGAPPAAAALSTGMAQHLQLELGVVLQRHNRLEDALLALRRAYEIAVASGDEIGAATGRCWLGDVEWMREHNREAREHFDAVQRLPGLSRPELAALRTKMLIGLAQCAGMDAQPIVADRLLDQVVARAVPPAERHFECAWAVLKGWLRIGGHGLGDPEAAIGFFERCLQRSRGADLFWYAAPCEIGIGLAHAELGLYDAALNRLSALVRSPSDCDNGRWQLSAGVWLAWCHLRRGDPAAALETARRARRSHAEFGPFMFASNLPALELQALVRMRRSRECSDPLPLVTHARGESLGYQLITLLEARIEWLAAHEKFGDALDCADELLREAEERGLPSARTSAMFWRTRLRGTFAPDHAVSGTQPDHSRLLKGAVKCETRKV